ncbi:MULTISPECIES: T9SS type A sorting domain-containing protein [Bacteroidales]|jgi:hypothetical protein|uniref:T9SS type A sorting domain-containing protein n=1 Tax=Bacteroidales TaxID=171549 RepID=UPI0006D7EC88|nr:MULTISPECIES: T9SS type A sorting domain-containing protein [Bacteroidales]
MKKIFLLFACMTAMAAYSQSSVMVANFEDDGTDRMFSDRIKEDGMTLIDTSVDNPLQNESNPSSKVMSLTEIQGGGQTRIGFAGQWTGSTYELFSEDNQILLAVDGNIIYDVIRMKVYVEGENIEPDCIKGFRASLFDYSSREDNNKFTATWNNPEYLDMTTTWPDWNVATIKLKVNPGNSGRMVLAPYLKWEGVADGVTIYIDDIELLNSADLPSSIEIEKAEKLDYVVNGKDLAVMNLRQGATMAVYDISGRNVMTTTVDSDNVHYTFTSEGIYIVSVNNGKNIVTEKVIIK